MNKATRICGWKPVAATGFIILLCGCRTYTPQPVNLEHHHEIWIARSFSSEDVLTFASHIPSASLHEIDGDSFDFSDGISLAEAEILGLVYNPGLRVSRAAVRTDKALADYAGLWNDPSLNFSLLRVLESIPQPWLLVNSLTFTLPVSGRLRARELVADARLESSLARIAQSEWDVRRKIRSTWVEWSASQLKFGQTESVVGDLGMLSESARQMAAAGELSPTQARLLEIEHATQLGELEKYRAGIESAEQKIRLLVGLSPNAEISLVPGFPEFAELEPDAASDILRQKNLNLAVFQREYEVAENALYLEIRKQYPDLTIGPQIESEEGVTRIGVGGNIPVPVLNSNKGGIAAALARRDTARITLESELERLQGTLAVYFTGLRGAENRLANFNERIMPLVDRQLDEARKLSQIGEGGVLLILESLVRVNQAKLNLIDIQSDRAKLNAEIYFLCGPDTFD